MSCPVACSVDPNKNSEHYFRTRHITVSAHMDHRKEQVKRFSPGSAMAKCTSICIANQVRHKDIVKGSKLQQVMSSSNLPIVVRNVQCWWCSIYHINSLCIQADRIFRHLGPTLATCRSSRRSKDNSMYPSGLHGFHIASHPTRLMTNARQRSSKLSARIMNS